MMGYAETGSLHYPPRLVSARSTGSTTWTGGIAGRMAKRSGFSGGEKRKLPSQFDTVGSTKFRDEYLSPAR